MYIGIDLGGSHIGMACVTPEGKIQKKFEKDLTSEDKSNIKQVITETIINVLQKWVNEDQITIEKIGIGVPGIVQNNQIVHAVNLGIKNLDLKTKLQEVFPKVDIKIQNDAKCAALAEKRLGALKKFKDCIFICLGTGIGGAAFYNNELIVPKRSSGFEFGHMIIQKNGNLCRCGSKGCFETYGSIKKFKNDVKSKLDLPEFVDGKDLVDIVEYNLNTDAIQDIINEYVDNLCVGISNIINILEPEAICLGGGFVHYKDFLLNKLKNKLYGEGYIFFKDEFPYITTAELGNDAGIIGSAMYI